MSRKYVFHVDSKVVKTVYVLKSVHKCDNYDEQEINIFKTIYKLIILYFYYYGVYHKSDFGQNE